MRAVVWILLLTVAPLIAQEPQGRRRPAGSQENAAGAILENPARPAAARPSAVDEATAEAPAFSEYRLGVEDMISVMVLDSPEFSRLVRVSGAGTIKLPLVPEPIPAAGKTCAELEQEIVRALIDDGLLRQPSVSVTVHEFHSKPVSISGAVKMPVMFQATRPVTLVEAISRAGGLSDVAGQEILISVPEREGQPARLVRVPTRSVTEVADGQANVWLRGGEDVRVPAAGRVYILGGVAKPGAVLINTEEPLTLLRALALSGGTTPTASSKAFLLRPSADSAPAGSQKQEIALDLKKLVKRQQPDLPLQTNDVIFVPDSRTKKVTQTGMAAAITSFVYSAGVLVWR